MDTNPTERKRVIMKANTFGDYEFPEWVNDDVKKSITDFWGCFGRTYKDWLESFKFDERENCYHKKYSGFGHPKMGELVAYRFRNGDIVIGRYIHAWNNIGRLIDSDGKTHYPSTCDIWCPAMEDL